MIRSRLMCRLPTKTVRVKKKTLASGQYTESDVTTNLTARWEPMPADEQISEAGNIIIVTDVFWFEPDRATCALPAITENHVLVDQDSNRYDVVSRSVDQAGGGSVLKVTARHIRDEDDDI